jgi:hypothetical protein
LSNGGAAEDKPVTKLAWRLLRIGAALLIATYLVDSAWFFLRNAYPAAGQASGSVHRVRLLAIPDKAGKTEYEIDAVQPEEDVPCSHSIFSHGGQRPCWYVTRHAKDPIQM